MLASTGELLSRGPGDRAPLFGFRDKVCGVSAQSAHHPCAASAHHRRMPADPPQQPADGPEIPLCGGKSARRPRGIASDRVIADLAVRQHGVVGVAQLVARGLSVRTVDKRVAAGRLYRVHQGVYAVGYPRLTTRGRWMAAVLACDPGAVLSHRSAAALWGLREDRRPSIDVTAPNRRGRAPTGISAHRNGSLNAADRTSLHGIPCTNVARTLLDLAAVLPVWELRKALSEAEVLRILDHDAVRRLIKRSRGRRGVARLRMLLDDIHPETKRTRSEMERLFLRMCDRAGLPRPEVNVALDVGGRQLRPDFLWRDAGLIIEADSRRYHDTDSAFQSDRRREQRLQLAGWRVSRCTWEQIDREPHVLAKTIRGLLAQPHFPPTGRKYPYAVENRPVGG
jgi:predicted transcriptional regulator of viral defense system